ncbi:MAG: hypothetical protein AAB676_16975 [Verrucomicrobiota bacterium]
MKAQQWPAKAARSNGKSNTRSTTAYGAGDSCESLALVKSYDERYGIRMGNLMVEFGEALFHFFFEVLLLLSGGSD